MSPHPGLLFATWDGHLCEVTRVRRLLWIFLWSVDWRYVLRAGNGDVIPISSDCRWSGDDWVGSVAGGSVRILPSPPANRPGAGQ